MANNEFYIGSTSDLKRRFKEHRNGFERTTKRFLPVRLEFYAAILNKSGALRFEKYLKTGSGLAFRKRHLA